MNQEPGVSTVPKRMLFIVPNRGSSFIEQDNDILSRHFEVNCLTYTHRLLPEIVKSVLARSFDLVFLWFLHNYALPVAAACAAARLPCVAVAGGVDLANNPEIGYGHMRYRSARIRARASLRLCSLVLPVSNFMRNRVLQLTSPVAMRVIYNGIDTGKFKPKGAKEDIVLSVARISEGNFLYKRFDLFIEAARYLPDYKFVLAGKDADGTVKRLKAVAPPNVDFPGYLSDEDLIRIYQRARVYAQLSHAEAFGCALAEAMACECVPVVVRRGALPEVVGRIGYYAPYGDPRGTSQTIRNAMTHGDGSAARDRIERMFTAKRRESQLVQSLELERGK